MHTSLEHQVIAFVSEFTEARKTKITLATLVNDELGVDGDESPQGLTTYMNTHQIKIQRDSVCMGDDADAPHSYSFNLSADATLLDVFEHLASKRYLASVSGTNHSWEAIIGNKSLALFKGNSQLPEVSNSIASKISQHSNNGVLNVRFKYNGAIT